MNLCVHVVAVPSVTCMQWRRYYSIMQKNQGPVYFAGEHLSVHHAWIEGALETSDLAVAEMVKQHADAQPAIIPHGFAPAHMKKIDVSTCSMQGNIVFGSRA